MGRLAGEAQSVLDAIVGQLAERCVERQSDGEVRLALGPLADQPAYLVRELLATVWRGQGWPRQAMGMAEWESLGAMVRTAGGDALLIHARAGFGVVDREDSVVIDGVQVVAVEEW